MNGESDIYVGLSRRICMQNQSPHNSYYYLQIRTTRNAYFLRSTRQRMQEQLEPYVCCWETKQTSIRYIWILVLPIFYCKEYVPKPLPVPSLPQIWTAHVSPSHRSILEACCRSSFARHTLQVTTPSSSKIGNNRIDSFHSRSIVAF